MTGQSHEFYVKWSIAANNGLRCVHCLGRGAKRVEFPCVVIINAYCTHCCGTGKFDDQSSWPMADQNEYLRSELIQREGARIDG